MLHGGIGTGLWGVSDLKRIQRPIPYLPDIDNRAASGSDNLPVHNTSNDHFSERAYAKDDISLVDSNRSNRVSIDASYTDDNSKADHAENGNNRTDSKVFDNSNSDKINLIMSEVGKVDEDVPKHTLLEAHMIRDCLWSDPMVITTHIYEHIFIRSNFFVCFYLKF